MVSICAALLLIAAGGTPLEPSEREAYIAKFVAQQKATQTYQADLKQTLRLRGLRQPVESEGRIYYQSPDSLAMIFTKPAGEFVIATASDLYVKKSRKALQHRKIDPKSAGQSDMLFMLALFREGATITREHFHADMIRTNDELLVTLIPKEADLHHRQPVAIENWIAESSLEIRKLRLTFERDNTMTYEFLNPVLNEPIVPEIFQPPHTEK